MRPRKPEAEKKKPGPRPHRTFYNKIGFHISNDIHQKMKELTKIRKIFLEDLYREALSEFLEIRANTPTRYQYIKPPSRPIGRHVTIEMEEALCQAIRHAAVDDRTPIAHVFETAVRHYLGTLSEMR